MTLNQLIKDTRSLGIVVLFSDIPDSKGRHLKLDNHKIIMIDKHLTDDEAIQILLHERAHFINNHYYNHLGTTTFCSKQEFEAEKARIEFNLNNYITSTPPEYWDTFNFIDYFGFDSHHENYINESFQKIVKNIN
ncbi:TPA: ImmA/IrrE family metallo-endopeptidase [Streptococcus agalactiae]